MAETLCPESAIFIALIFCMYDICIIGHITNDRIVTKHSVNYMPGGTAFYCSKALLKLQANSILLTAVGEAEMQVVRNLQNEGIEIKTSPSRETVFFENIYHEDQDHRDQNVLAIADAFTDESVDGIDAKIYHLGPLLLHDIPVSIIKKLASKGIVSLDAQGYLRSVINKKVHFANWKDKEEALPYVSILKANEFEMEMLAGTNDPYAGARALASMGVKEVIITLGSKGSIVFYENNFTEIPAFAPKAVVDATGCGDTYMAGYLYKKTDGATIAESGAFGAAMATLKIQSSGPFSSTQAAAELLSKAKVV
jgi:sugar/nucleoside kinase (ribokinase family)